MPTLSGPEYLNGQFSVAADGTVSLTTPPLSTAGGTISPGPVIISNTASAPQASTDSPLFWVASEATEVSALVDAYGGSLSYFIGRRSRGTAAAPTALQFNDGISQFTARGRGATGYGTAGSIMFKASENWTDAAHGSFVEVGTITPATTTAVARVQIKQGVVIGNAAPDPGQGALVLNANAAAPQPTTVAPQAWIAGQDGAQALAVVDAYGALPSLLLRRAQGTAAVPAAVASGSNLGAINAAGFGVSTYATSAQLAFGTLETQSETARGMQITSATAAIGSTTMLTRSAVRQGLLVFDGAGAAPTGGTGGDMGGGTVNVPGGYYVNGGGATGVALVASGNSYINGGNVGIGITAPANKLHIVAPSIGAYLAQFTNSHNTAGDLGVIINCGATGTDTTTTLLAFYNGAVTVQQGGIYRAGASAVSYATTSDARLKDSITESERGLDALMAIKVSDYTMGKTAQQGLLAQDVAKVYPEAVHEGGKDPNLQPWMLDYGRLTPLLIKGMQQQQETIAALAAEVKGLAAKVAALESATVH